MPGWNVAASRGAEASPIVQAAERLVARIEGLVAEVTALRAENAGLRQEVRDAVAMLQQAGAAAGAGGSRRGRRAAAAVEGAKPRRRRAAGTNGRRRRAKAAKGRATPASVTGQVVRAVLGKLGSATASEIAREITAAGTPVSGRAVRFIAERAGAQTFVGDDGQRRYRLT